MSTAPIGPWRFGNGSDDVVADHPTGHDDPRAVEAYGGHLVAESIPPQYRALISAAPELLAALQALLSALQHGAMGRTLEPFEERAHAAIAKATGSAS